MVAVNQETVEIYLAFPHNAVAFQKGGFEFVKPHPFAVNALANGGQAARAPRVPDLGQDWLLCIGGVGRRNV